MRALLEVLGRMECQLTFVRAGPSTVGTLGNQLPSRTPSCPVPLARQAGVPRNEAAGRLCLLRLRSLRRHNGVFRGFGNPELHYLLRGDFVRCARSRVPTHPRLATRTSRPIPGSKNKPFFLTSVTAMWANRLFATFLVISQESARVWTICVCVIMILSFRLMPMS